MYPSRPIQALRSIRSQICEFTIDQSGMHLGRRFQNVTGVLSGSPVHLSPGDIERAWSQFEEGALARRRARAPSADDERRKGGDRRED